MRTIIAGFDSFDLGVLEVLHESGRTPSLSILLDAGRYSLLGEVGWTSTGTGLDPAPHAPLDFVGLDQSYIEPPLQVGPQGSVEGAWV